MTDAVERREEAWRTPEITDSVERLEKVWRTQQELKQVKAEIVKSFTDNLSKKEILYMIDLLRSSIGITNK